MTTRYPHLLSPIKVGDLILRNRMTAAPSTPHFLQAAEDWPTEKWITHFANRAKSGASLVTINHLVKNDGMNFPGSRRSIDNMADHFNKTDLENINAQSYLCQMIDAMHFYGAKTSGYLMPPTLKDSGDKNFFNPDLSLVSKEVIQAQIQEVIQQAIDIKRLGFDMVSLHGAYRRFSLGQFISPLSNNRTDEYGGDLEKRAKFIFDICDGIKAACGKNFPIELMLSVSEPEGGNRVEDVIEFAKMAEGRVDILHLRHGETDPQHPLGFTSTPENPTPLLDEIGRVKQSGTKIVIGASAGFTRAEYGERALAEGKADLICMARSWIFDPEFGKKVYEDRGEDIVPCIRCNKCHVSNKTDMFRSVCSVNPKLGFEDKLERMIDEPVTVKKVAIVGGGPAGMQAAVTAAQRGHSVTLYEKEAVLGGQLNQADQPSFKWPLRQYKEYMINQVYKHGVTVCLNTAVTREMLSAENYDAVLVAIGAVPTAPPIPGIDGDNCFFANGIYGREQLLGKKVAIIGGGDIGTETGMHLAEKGYDATVIEMLPELLMDAPAAHYKQMVKDAWMAMPNFHSVCNARCTKIDSTGVYYVDKDGSEGKVEADSVIISAGARALSDEAMELFGAARYTYAIGDCDKAGNLQKATRSAFAIASTL